MTPLITSWSHIAELREAKESSNAASFVVPPMGEVNKSAIDFMRSPMLRRAQMKFALLEPGKRTLGSPVSKGRTALVEGSTGSPGVKSTFSRASTHVERKPEESSVLPILKINNTQKISSMKKRLFSLDAIAKEAIDEKKEDDDKVVVVEMQPQPINKPAKVSSVVLTNLQKSGSKTQLHNYINQKVTQKKATPTLPASIMSRTTATGSVQSVQGQKKRQHVRMLSQTCSKVNSPVYRKEKFVATKIPSLKLIYGKTLHFHM